MSYLSYVVQVLVVINLFDLQLLGLPRYTQIEKFCNIEVFLSFESVDLIL